jgi:WD40 repeat protein
MEVLLKKKAAQRVILLILSLILFLLLFSTFDIPTTEASSILPEGIRYAWLSPSVATLNTYRVTLTISNLMGSYPPSAKWYDPDGQQIAPAGSGGYQIRYYEYYYGSLVATYDYFYISGRDLEPGTYRVVVSGYFDGTFVIKSPEIFNYLPLFVIN